MSDDAPPEPPNTAHPNIQPGKSTKPPEGGGVHPPTPGWGGKKKGN